MPWWTISSIPKECLTQIVFKFLIYCPSSIRKKENIGINNKGKPSTKTTYEPVSAQKRTFKERGIIKDLLTTILFQIRKLINDQGVYQALEENDNVEEQVLKLLEISSLNDAYFDIIVFNKRNDMPETEAIYYYIRNAFAHGSFEVKKLKGGYIYLLECKRGKQIKAQIRIKERNLKRILEFIEMTPTQIRDMRKVI